MLAKVCGAALQGIDAIRISIETLVEPGFSITLVGMPDKAVKESIQRVESAVNHSALEFPRRKILINMAPAEVRKEGAPTTCRWPWASSPPTTRFRPTCSTGI